MCDCKGIKIDEVREKVMGEVILIRIENNRLGLLLESMRARSSQIISNVDNVIKKRKERVELIRQSCKDSE